MTIKPIPIVSQISETFQFNKQTLQKLHSIASSENQEVKMSWKRFGLHKIREILWLHFKSGYSVGRLVECPQTVTSCPAAFSSPDGNINCR